MLTKLERKILRICNKCNSDFIDTTDIQRHAKKLSTNDIASCCSHLHEYGYFEIYGLNLANEVRLTLSYKGQHYREISWNQVKEFIFKSILVPIGVSISTTLLLNLLK